MSYISRILLAAPRRSPAVPNEDGTLALYTVSTYNFESHSKTSEIRAIDISNGQSTLITNDEETSEPHWLGFGNELLWLKSGKKDSKGSNKTNTEIVIGDVNEIGKSYSAASVPGAILDVKLKALDQDRIAIAFSAKARPDGTMYNPDDEPKMHSSARVYDSVMVRHWDR